MHEIGVVRMLLKQIDQVMEEEQLTAVTRITLEVGELSGYVPKYLTDCFEAAKFHTRFEAMDTRLELNVVPGITDCKDCGHRFSACQYNLECPKCHGQNLKIVSGNDLIVTEIEAY